MPSLNYRGRFAPSPTGPLHLGSMLAAFGSWLLARHARGQWLVRIEDVDPPREVPGAAELQLATLAAFGLHADQPVQYQSRRHTLYQTASARLLAKGKAFHCHCSRADLASQHGIHRHCAASQQRAQPAIRLRVADGSHVTFNDALQGQVAQDVDRDVGDFVLLRADGCWAYQLAVVVDDAEQRISHVVRGADLVDSTPRQILLQQALGVPTPHYLHLPLLLGSDGHKLSKSLAAMPVDAGAPLPVLRWLWAALGQAPAALDASVTVAELLQHAVTAFDPGSLQKESRIVAGSPPG
ncbi:glutamyl-Q tRNA(Asp) ligase [Stenotrophomonas humi]|uniref:Glutamyl-Q tRNA(Asp) synthetase n=1 Tax=Stenotrophomonas humi TaxID=405444 RepID=A0A0R0C5Q8_9GAMM|nr:tRNA glutamyl-Q(34) synthetase GluQRS [Stenotrophomonas humi]KRG65065.1 glutamyl-Q tRNA(Asp) ligase [Stenotrophomonas humi]